MTLTQMRQVLDGRGIQLTKSLGQNFLHDGNQLRRIVEAAELTKADRVLEIGPGLGPLTEALLHAAGEVLAIEKDARLVEVLRERFDVVEASRLLDCGEIHPAGGTPALRLLHADALDWLQQTPRDWSGWKLVANLPYSVASPILVELAMVPQPPERMVVTLQLEVAQRLAASANDDDYGILSLMVQLRFEPRGLFRIPAACFFPSPDVDSACLRLDRRERELLPVEQHQDYVRLVKLAFSQRRKMMMKLLKSAWPEVRLQAVFEELNLSPQVRAEAVTLEQFAQLTRLLRA